MLYTINEKLNFNYDYTKCMVMKLPIAHPSKDGKNSVVINDCEDALDIIKKTDAMTQGITKIIYLVGWQYLGHDDKYPDFFQVNNAIKRTKDKTAHESLIWLYEEAKKYNTVVSVHINFNDAYDNAPSFERYVKANALVRNKRGKIHAIENYNGRKCYKVSLKEEWESGLFQERFDKLLEVLPLVEAGTVHVDNFQCYHSYKPDVSIKEMQDARRKMILYVKEKGIDITSEFTYREHEKLPNKMIFGLPREHNSKIPMDTLGIIPASWWCTRMTRQEYVNIPPQLYGGMYKDKRYKNYLYSNIHGEVEFGHYSQGDIWEKEFLYSFATMQVPYHFLCQFTRKEIKGHFSNEYCIYKENIVSYNKNRKIVFNDIVIKENDNLLLPLINKEDTLIAYSKNGDERTWSLIKKGFSSANIYKVTSKGNEFLRKALVSNDTLTLKILPNEALIVELCS